VAKITWKIIATSKCSSTRKLTRRAPYVKPPFAHPTPKKNLHEVTVDEAKDTDDEVDVQYPSTEMDVHDECTADEMEEVEKQFISVLNLDCDPFNESEYNCIPAIRNKCENDE